MQALEHKIPPPIVLIILMIIMWGFSKFGLTIELSLFVRGVVIALLLITGTFFGVSGLYSFKQAATTIHPLKPEAASSLVTTGVYRITRNPMYVGLLIFLLAWGIYLFSLLSFLCIPLFVVYMNRFQILPEERALKSVKRKTLVVRL